MMFSRSKTVAENLKMSPPLLSRFDLIFILLDTPDEERDSMLSEHVIKKHGGPSRRTPQHISPHSSQGPNSQMYDRASLSAQSQISQNDHVYIPSQASRADSQILQPVNAYFGRADGKLEQMLRQLEGNGDVSHLNDQ